MEINRVVAGEGVNWYVRGWHLFVKKPLQWVLMFLAPLMAAAALFWLLPALGSLVLSLFGPVVGAGLYHAARMADEGGEPNLSMLFEGFRRREATTPLLILGAIALAVTFASELLGARLIGSASSGMGMGDDVLPMPHMGASSLFALLIVLAIEFAMTIAFLYAVPLVWFKGVAPVDAIKASFSGGLKNFVPLLVFGLIGSVLTVLAMLPVMLGLLVLVPVMFLAMYHSYQSLFGANTAGSAVEITA
jgi:uncharacterized membrane protein